MNFVITYKDTSDYAVFINIIDFLVLRIRKFFLQPLKRDKLWEPLNSEPLAT